MLVNRILMENKIKMIYKYKMHQTKPLKYKESSDKIKKKIVKKMRWLKRRLKINVEIEKDDKTKKKMDKTKVNHLNKTF